MSKTYNWGILAPGNIAGKFVTELKEVQNAVVLAVGSRDLARATEFASMHGIERSYGSYEELASDPDVDIIYVASPHTFHAAHTILCLKHKKAVLCEKAFGMNAEEVKMMIQTAREEHTFLMEAFFTPHQPSYQEARKILDSGVLGEIKHIQGWFGFNRSPYSPSSRLINPELGGSALLDIGLYPLFDVLLFMGQPTRIAAFADLTPQKTDMTVSVAMEFEGGNSANIFASLLAAAGVGTDILCEKGVLRLRRINAIEQTLEILLPGEAARVVEFEKSACGLKQEAIEVMKCLSNNQLESTVMSHQSSLQLMQNLDQIRLLTGINC